MCTKAIDGVCFGKTHERSIVPLVEPPAVDDGNILVVIRIGAAFQFVETVLRAPMDVCAGDDGRLIIFIECYKREIDR